MQHALKNVKNINRLGRRKKPLNRQSTYKNKFLKRAMSDDLI